MAIVELNSLDDDDDDDDDDNDNNNKEDDKDNNDDDYVKAVGYSCDIDTATPKGTSAREAIGMDDAAKIDAAAAAVSRTGRASNVPSRVRP